MSRKLLLEALEDRTLPSTFIVVNTLDDSNPGSLRWAINQANTTANVGGPDTITFAIGSGIQTIAPLSALPTITDSVIIDGTTQPGYSGTPVTELSGADAGAGATGLIITAAALALGRLFLSLTLEGDWSMTAMGASMGGDPIVRSLRSRAPWPRSSAWSGSSRRPESGLS
jgi:hypothetical protein